MSYATAIMVKDRIGLARGDVTQDYLIEGALAYGDGYVDAEFERASITVPSPVPQAVKDASADLAAYYMLRKKDLKLALEFKTSGLVSVMNYLTAKYSKGVFDRSSQM